MGGRASGPPIRPFSPLTPKRAAVSWIAQLKTRRPSLFWRTFLLLCGLIFFSVIGWLQSFRVLSELPYSQGVAQHIVSTVNITKYALVTADPLYRTDLLRILAVREGVLISPRDETDKVVKIQGEGFNGLIEQLVKTALGPETIIASSVNGAKGLWVTFDIEGDNYWLQSRDDVLDPPYGTAWLWWAVAACLASLFGASLLARHVIEPLSRLSAFATQLGQGRNPDPLPEDASTAEIQAVNVSFNRMVQDLKRIEADRELLLAGVSHDLRTPITRLRLEVELADLPDDSRTAMVSDLEQMENIVNQFLAYARRSGEDQAMINAGEAVYAAIDNARIEHDESVILKTAIEPDLFVMANPLELSRAIQNLITNAQRYGRSDDGKLRLTITLKRSDNKQRILLIAQDEGAGLPATERERVMRPFERGESARSGVTGSGLGLAIVDRIVRRSGGCVALSDTTPHGLTVTAQFPMVSPSAVKKALKEAMKSDAGHKKAQAPQKPAESSAGDGAPEAAAASPVGIAGAFKRLGANVKASLELIKRAAKVDGTVAPPAADDRKDCGCGNEEQDAGGSSDNSPAGGRRDGGRPPQA